MKPFVGWLERVRGAEILWRWALGQSLSAVRDKKLNLHLQQHDYDKTDLSVRSDRFSSGAASESDRIGLSLSQFK